MKLLALLLVVAAIDTSPVNYGPTQFKQTYGCYGWGTCPLERACYRMPTGQRSITGLRWTCRRITPFP